MNWSNRKDLEHLAGAITTIFNRVVEPIELVAIALWLGATEQMDEELENRLIARGNAIAERILKRVAENDSVIVSKEQSE